MWMVTTVVLMAGGLLGAANLIAARKPDARAMIEKLTPFQGWIGIVLVVWGLRDSIYVLRSMAVLSAAPFWWLVNLITTLTELALGFLLGYGLITKYVLSGRPQALEKGQQLQGQLAKYQGPLGVAAIAIAILFALLSLMRKAAAPWREDRKSPSNGTPWSVGSYRCVEYQPWKLEYAPLSDERCVACRKLYERLKRESDRLFEVARKKRNKVPKPRRAGDGPSMV